MAFDGIPQVETVLHPSDFSKASDNAFAHALAIALRSARLNNILVPVDREPSPDGALDLAARAAEALGEGGVDVHLLHVGERAPRLDPPEIPGVAWRSLVERGEPVDVIVQTAERVHADLVIMATEGRYGFVDALRGSTTEQVLRRVPCPLLAVPSR